MGRYKSLQSFTDEKTKVVEGYKGSTGAATGGGRAPAPAPERPEKVDNVSGSTAGAGSCDFHLYRAARNREIVRLESLESAKAKELDRAAFAAKVEENKKEAEARTRKNAELRRKRKQKKKLLATQKRLEEGKSDDEESNDDEEESRAKEGEGDPTEEHARKVSRKSDDNDD